MLTEDAVAQRCAARTFQRARQIADHGKNMLTKQCRYGAFDTALSAFVAASSGWADRYRASVVLDEDEREIIDYSCTCPAFLKDGELCKHAAALALAYADDPTSFLGYKEQRTPETSPSIAAFMQRAERIAAEEEAESVHIDATLVYGYENWSARFRVRGARGSYVLKSISDFASALKTGAYVSYGKKLAFTHVPALFDDRSRAIACFLERAVAQRERPGDAARWRRTPAAGRDLNLTEGEVVELVDLLADDPFDFECTDASLRSRMRVHVVEGNPTVPLRILRSERGGYEIARDENIVFAAEGTRMYVLQDDMLFRCTPAFARIADFLRNVYRAGDDVLYITAGDMPLFCATVLPTLEKALEVSAPPELELMRPVAARLEFYLDKTDRAVEITALVRYGAQAFALVEPAGARAAEVAAKFEGAGTLASACALASAGTPASTQTAASPSEPTGTFAPLRDEALEERTRKLVRTYFSAGGTLSLHDEELVAELVFGGLAQLRAVGEVFTTPAFDRLITDRKPRVTLGLSLAGNLIDLDISSDDVDAAELAGILSSYRRRKRYHRLRNGAFLSLADYDLRELDQLTSDLGISMSELASGHIELPTYRAFYLDRAFSDARRDASFQEYVDRFRAIDPNTYQVPSSLAGTLRPYQRDGFFWMSTLTDMGFGGILADEMGLGKSVQLISLLLARADEARATGPTLVVCPASLVYNWVAEFTAFAPSLVVRAVEGTRTDRARIRAEANVDVFVTSYDLARVDAEGFASRRFWCCVLDEAQYIKNHATLTTRAVKRIDAEHRFALTGTPMENRLSEIWSIFDFLMPGFLGSYARFRERYELDILGGNKDTAERLQALVGPFVLRRSKESVLPELPDKLENIVYVPLEGEQRRLYAAAEQNLRQELAAQKRSHEEKFSRSKVEVLSELTRLRQIALDPSLVFENFRGSGAKMDAVMGLVEQTRDAGAKALVFSQFTSYLARLSDELDARGIPYYTITGATPKKQRLALVNAFNTDDVPVFLISLKAGGTGLNLTGASVVIHADPWWNAAATNQATDRAHRIGQRNIVSVYKVIAKNTVEERILALQQAKTELAGSVIGSADAPTLASLTREELLDLLTS